jgi:hypothetical protein
MSDVAILEPHQLPKELLLHGSAGKSFQREKTYKDGAGIFPVSSSFVFLFKF